MALASHFQRSCHTPDAECHSGQSQTSHPCPLVQESQGYTNSKTVLDTSFIMIITGINIPGNQGENMEFSILKYYKTAKISGEVA
jgi:hypothetical protein